ncbi:MAG: radical SAM protein [Candidatus Coatesbacteria bacterium]|nr:radical SAM protein [Candidatus Coatesbacteria bacterium]
MDKSVLFHNLPFLKTAAKTFIHQNLPLDYYLLKGYSFKPYLVVFDMLYACNLSCPFCWQGRTEANKPDGAIKGFLRFNELKLIADKISGFSPRCYLTGGEPLLHPDIISFISYLTAKNLYVSLNTNGVLLHESAESIIKAELTRLIISLDGTKEVQDKLRGESFDRIGQGIEKIIRFKKDSLKSLPSVRINLTLNKDNISDLPDFLKLMKNWGLNELKIQHNMFSTNIDIEKQKNINRNVYESPYMGISYDPEGELLDRGQLKELMERLEELSSKSGIDITYFPLIEKNLIDEYYTYPPSDEKFSKKCLAPWQRVRVLPNAQLSPCLGIEMGNILESDFTDIWNGEKYRKFRNMIRENLFPVCSRCCLKEY